MKQLYTSIILVITLLLSAMALAQEAQKSFINYQGVARNADNELMISEILTIGVALKFGAANATIEYEENHSVTTDANGVFSLKIGNGAIVSGDFNVLPWGTGATFATIAMNGNEIGTTEMMAVPHALSSADNQWHTLGDDIENKNGGNVFVTGSLYASKDLSLTNGVAVNEFSSDVKLTANSDAIVPTQKAVKTYVDGKLGSGGGGIVDADADPTNELQTLAFDAGTNALSLSDGNTVTIPSGGTDADADPTNEIQDISLSGTELSISGGSTIDLSPIVPPGGTDDQNAGEVAFDNTSTGLAAIDTQAAIEELASGGLIDTDNQNLSLSGTTLQITDGTGVDLGPLIPVGGTDDQNASEVVFDNTGTGLAAVDTQAAIEELASGMLVDTDNQGLVLTGDVLTIEDGVGSIDLSDYVDVTTKTGILLGDGTAISGLIGTVDGQVAKWNAGTSEWEAGTDDVGGGGSSLWSESGSDIFFNSGKVGVGTSTPNTNFEVAGTGTVRHRITSSDASVVNLQWFLPGAANTDWVFAAGGSDMQFNYSSSDFSGGLVHTRLMDNGTLNVSKTIQSGDLAGSGQRNVMADADGKLVIGAGSGSLWSENGANLFYNDGNVGIGTNAPAAQFEINSSQERPFILRSTKANNYMQYVTPSGPIGYSGVWSGDNDVDFGTVEFNGIGKVHLTTKATPRLTVAANGNVGIGGTSPTSRLHIFQKSQTVGTGLRFSDGTANKDWDITHGFALRFHYGGDLRGFINATTGAYTQASDRRLKTDIANLGDVLDRVKQLQPSTYKYKSSEISKTTIGLIAQEVESLFPELVSTVEEEDLLGLDYGGFSIVAIKAIQEQQQIIDKQSKKISNLEERLQRLEASLGK